MILGFTGKNGSGKTEICKYLELKGFKYYSLSDILREELRKRNEKITRENLIKLGNELRGKLGPEVLARLVLKKIGNENCCIDSIRNPKEVEELRKRKDFILIAVEAPIELRFQRIKARNREEDKIDFEEFKKLENEESSNSDFGQNIEECIKKADVVVDNSSTIKELHKKIDLLLSKIENREITNL